MQAFPHHYRTDSSGSPDGEVIISSEGLEDVRTAPPREFGGPGDKWSPETLLLGGLADCYLLTFRAVAKHVGLAWNEMHCAAEGKVDRVDRAIKFTEIVLRVSLSLPEDGDEEAARKALDKAKRACVISNSLGVRPELRAEVRRG